MKHQIQMLIKNYILPIAAGVVVAWFSQAFVIGSAEVVSGSMTPTIPFPSRLVVDKVAVETSPLYRGEVVLFHPTVGQPKENPLLKRIVGLPGDTVKITNGVIYIDGKVYDNPLIHEPQNASFGPFHVPAGHYFMLGDHGGNASDSWDSRYWPNPYVATSAIYARVDAIVWPPKDARIIH